MMTLPRFLRVVCPSLFIVLWFACAVVGQTETATVSGLVTDRTAAAVSGSEVRLQSVDRGTVTTTTTNDAGIYVFPSVQPGQYQIRIQKQGFKQVDLLGLIVNVQDHIQQNFRLEVGSVAESVTVTAGTPLVNTTDATVSTVVDRRFAENLPLNGRSFQTLIALTPGVVLTPASATEQGQFSVNGQRADANYFMVDGVSANISAGGGGPLGQPAGGALPGFSALGGTNSLVSVDAMQEFRIQTSSFAPEFGRTPGGQISIVTRSGTNQFHGSLFDYFRNDVLDASDWFADRNGLPKPKDRQNDFGGVFGGPIIKDRTFLFFSYEGLRLRQPLTQQTAVPSTTPPLSRQAAPPQIQPFLNAYPLPNGPDFLDAKGNPTGLAQFNASYSDPSTLDAYGIRVDHTVNSKLALFGRYSYSPSETSMRGPLVLSNTLFTEVKVHTLTIGSTQSVKANMSNELRANYSNLKTDGIRRTDNFGGAVPQSSLPFPVGNSSANSFFGFTVNGAGSINIGKNGINEQRQVNLVDNLSVVVGSHQLKLGVDYRWLSPISSPFAYSQTATFSGMTGPTGALSGKAQTALVQAVQGSALLAQNFSFYGQDTWKVTPRLNLTYGLRWDVNPAPKGKNSSSALLTIQGLDNPATMTLAPPGTPLYKTTHGNLAPRLGVAYQLKQKRGWETVLRGGVGMFYDLGSGFLGNFTGEFPYLARKPLGSVPFPLTPQQAAAPAFSRSAPVTGNVNVSDPNLKLPRTYQWNVALEQSVGATQTVSVTYIGASGRKLLREDTLFSPNPSFPMIVFVGKNTATSDYHALQVKFERRLSRGLQALASYTWSHSIDIASNDSGVLNTPAVIGTSVDRGNSDFDLRHAFTGALTYDLPSPWAKKPVHAVLGDWALDTFITARSAPPVNILGPNFIVAGTIFQARPNIVSGVPLYLFGPQYPGGKAFNKSAFVNPPSGTEGDLGRNVLRGFGAWQTDFALRRQFHPTERLALQFRAEFFNIFNHPNFGQPTVSLVSALFGQSTQMFGRSLTSTQGGFTGGLSPLYQVGGPRSTQLALKLLF